MRLDRNAETNLARLQDPLLRGLLVIGESRTFDQHGLIDSRATPFQPGFEETREHRRPFGPVFERGDRRMLRVWFPRPRHRGRLLRKFIRACVPVGPQNQHGLQRQTKEVQERWRRHEILVLIRINVGRKDGD